MGHIGFSVIFMTGESDCNQHKTSRGFTSRNDGDIPVVSPMVISFFGGFTTEPSWDLFVGT